jgi:predicted PurR-regulated permease PerM
VSKILDKKNIVKIMGIAAGAILFYWALQNISAIFIFLGIVLKLLAPLMVGICIAFILNIPMRAFESRLLKKRNVKLRRLVGLLLTIILALAVFILVLLIVIPEVWQTLETLGAKFPNLISRVRSLEAQVSDKLPSLGDWLSEMELNWENIMKTSIDFLQSGAANIFNSTINIATSVFSGIYTFLFGFVFAMYILFQKENLMRQARKLLYAFLPEEKADRIGSICTLTNKTFSKFITGQCTEAVILGLMFLVTLSVFRFPYAVVIAVLVTCTALIPIFGAYIACIIGAFLILLASPVKAFWFVILFFVLQQIEGNLIYPRIVGKSVGLPALWVMTAVIIGGSIMGIVGMLISVPLCAVLYILLRESVDKKLAKMNIPSDKICGGDLLPNQKKNRNRD